MGLPGSEDSGMTYLVDEDEALDMARVHNRKVVERESGVKGL